MHEEQKHTGCLLPAKTHTEHLYMQVYSFRYRLESMMLKTFPVILILSGNNSFNFYSPVHACYSKICDKYQHHSLDYIILVIVIIKFSTSCRLTSK